MALGKHLAWIIVAIGGAVVAYYVHRVGVSTLASAFAAMGWSMAGLLALPIFLYVVHALGWSYTISADNRRRAGLLRLSVLQAVSYGIAGVIPLQVFVSEPLKLAFLQDPAYDKDDLAASLVVDNTINGIAIFTWAAGGLVYLAAALVEDLGLRLAILSPVVIMIALSSMLIFVQRKGLFSGLLNLLARIPLFVAFAGRHRMRAERIDQHVRDFYRSNRRGFYLALFFHILEKLHGVAEFWVIFNGLGMSVSWGKCFFIFAVVSTLDNLLFFVQLGGMEAWVSSLLTLMGITRDKINFTAALFRRVRFLFWAVCALLFIYPGRRLFDGSRRSGEDPR
jgi:hypothetical protein